MCAVVVGMGGGLHTTFKVQGQHTPASTWLIACRLARRGHIVVLLDEFNTSKVYNSLSVSVSNFELFVILFD